MRFFADNKDYRVAKGQQPKEAMTGDRVYINNPKHPHYMVTGELIAYEKYGPAVLGFEGWRVRDDDGNEFYAKTKDIFPCMREKA